LLLKVIGFYAIHWLQWEVIGFYVSKLLL
jgi:hypothetical protein